MFALTTLVKHNLHVKRLKHFQTFWSWFGSIFIAFVSACDFTIINGGIFFLLFEVTNNRHNHTFFIGSSSIKQASSSSCNFSKIMQTFQKLTPLLRPVCNCTTKLTIQATLHCRLCCSAVNWSELQTSLPSLWPAQPVTLTGYSLSLPGKSAQIT